MRKIDGERRSRCSNRPINRDGDVNSAGPIPSSELRRYGKKLEEAVRSREHAADVARRLTADKSLPRKRVSNTPGVPGPFKASGPVVDGNNRGRGKGRGCTAARGGGDGTSVGGSRRLKRDSRPSLLLMSTPLHDRAWPERPQPKPLLDPHGLPNTDTPITIAHGNCGRGPVQDDAHDTSPAAVAAAGATARGRGGLLATKLRGVVRVSREEEALGDERFWS